MLLRRLLAFDVACVCCSVGLQRNANALCGPKVVTTVWSIDDHVTFSNMDLNDVAVALNSEGRAHHGDPYGTGMHLEAALGVGCDCEVCVATMKRDADMFGSDAVNIELTWLEPGDV